MNNIFIRFVFLSTVVCSFGVLQAELDNSLTEQDKQTIPAIVLGGGVSGLSAAVCLAQEGVPCLVIEGAKPGGSLAFAQSVRNWPGKKDASGAEIVEEIREHVLASRVLVMEEEATEVDFSKWPYRIKSQQLDDGTVHERYALSCIIAMGSEPNLLGVPGESGPNGYFGNGEHTCVWCDGPLYDGKKIAIVGGGQGAVFEARHMSKIAREVVIIVQDEQFSVKDTKELDRLLAKPNVSVLFNTQVQEIKGDGQSVTHLSVKNKKTNELSDIEIDGVFLAIGSRPKTVLFKDQITLSPRNAIVLERHQATSKDGVFAVGDICESMFNQAIASAGQGCIAALQVKTFLESIGIQPPAKKHWGYDANWSWRSECEQFHEARSKAASSGAMEVGSVKEFEELVLKSKRLVVVDFYSPTCPACKFMMPTFEELAKNYGSDIDFVKVNITKSQLSANSLVRRVQGADIKSIPTFVFVRNGKEIGRASNLRSKDHLKQEFAKYR